MAYILIINNRNKYTMVIKSNQHYIKSGKLYHFSKLDPLGDVVYQTENASEMILTLCDKLNRSDMRE